MFNLLWKEWHEQRWKFAFGCIVLGSLLAIGLRARIMADQTTMLIACATAIVLLPLLAGVGLLSSERSDGTLETLCALPIRPSRIMAVKALMGIAVCAGPMLVLLAVIFLIAGEREMNRWNILAIIGRAVLAELSLLFWYLAVTARLSGEARAGLVAVGVLICWLLITLGLINFLYGPLSLQGTPLGHRYWQPIYGVSPLAGVMDIDFQLKYGPPMWFAAMVQLAIASMLWVSTLGALKRTNAGRAD
jgi:ABC-type transport system involved in multi-copper enzyme maturation permease subunit